MDAFGVLGTHSMGVGIASATVGAGVLGMDVGAGVLGMASATAGATLNSGVLGISAIMAALAAAGCGADVWGVFRMAASCLENIFCVTHLFSKVARGRIALSECGGGNRNDA